MTQKTLQRRVLDLEEWKQGCQERMKPIMDATFGGGQAAPDAAHTVHAAAQAIDDHSDFSVEGTRTGRYKAAQAVEDYDQVTIAQLKSDVEHWAQKAHTYRDQCGEFSAEINTLRSAKNRYAQANDRQSTVIQEYIKAKEKLEIDLAAALHTKKVSQGNNTGLWNQMKKLEDEKQELQAKFDTLSANCTALRMGETRKQISELEVEGNSLRYQNKQGNKIRDELHERITKLDEILDRQSATIIKQDTTIDAKIAQVDERGVHLDNADSVIEEQVREIAKHQKRTDAQFNLIQQLRGTISANRANLTKKIAHVLIYQYKDTFQFQLAGVFTSRDLMDDWVRENPPSKREEVREFNLTLNEGEL